MKNVDLNSCIHVRLGAALVVLLVVAGCASGGPNQPKPWEDKRRAQAHVDLGVDYLRRGQFDVARNELELAISIDPSSDQAYHAQGLLMAQTGYEDEATKLFARAVSINPGNFQAVNDYGIYLCETGDHQKGIDVLQRVESRPDNQLLSNTRLGLGLCKFQKGNYAEAKEHFKEVLQAEPRLPQALLPMAEIAYQEQNFLSARAFIERYIFIGAMTERILVVGTNTELQLGDSEKAAQYARELRRLYPQSTHLTGFRPLLTGG